MVFRKIHNCIKIPICLPGEYVSRQSASLISAPESPQCARERITFCYSTGVSEVNCFAQELQLRSIFLFLSRKYSQSGSHHLARILVSSTLNACCYKSIQFNR